MSEISQGKVISVFGSHAPLLGSKDYEMSRKLGRMLAQAGFGVATGGYGGVMSGASQGASEAGGRAIGVSSAQVESTRPVQLNRWINVHIPYDSLAERLDHLVKNNHGMIVLPGGIGTLSEFSLAWSYLQVGEISSRPLVLLGDMWSETVRAFDRPEYVARENLDLLYVAASVEDAVDHIRNYHLVRDDAR